MNKDMLAFLKGVLTVAVLLLLSTPLILMNVFQGDLSGPWIGFWGSFAGGILGTAGVIYVAHLQNQSQIDRMKEAEKHNRDRLKITTYVSKLEEFLSDLNLYINTIDEIYQEAPKLYRDLLFYIRITEEGGRKPSVEEIEYYLDRMRLLRSKSINISRKFYNLSDQEVLLLDINILEKGFLTNHQLSNSTANAVNTITILLDDVEKGVKYSELKHHVETMGAVLKSEEVEILVQESEERYYTEKTFKSIYEFQNALLNSKRNIITQIARHLGKL